MFRQAAAILAVSLFALSGHPAAAQQIPDGEGALLFHGNYCGPGNRGFDKAPIDELDAACRSHDVCYGSAPITTCSCNAGLARDASKVALSPKTEPDVAVLAGVVANGALALPCHP